MSSVLARLCGIARLRRGGLFLLSFALGGFAASAAEPALELSLAVASGDQPLYAGWPMIVRTTVALASDSAAGNAALAEFRWAVTDKSGGSQAWQPVASSSQPATATLTDDEPAAVFFWTLAPDQTAKLAGTYTLNVSFRGTTARATLTLLPEPPLRPEEQTRKRLAFCDYFLVTGNNAAALSSAQDELKVNATSVSAMSRAATALERLDRKPEAIALLGQAIAAFEQQHPTAENEPSILEQRLSALLNSAAGARP